MLSAVKCDKLPQIVGLGTARSILPLSWKFLLPPWDATIPKKGHLKWFLSQRHSLALIELYKRGMWQTPWYDAKTKLQEKTPGRPWAREGLQCAQCMLMFIPSQITTHWMELQPRGDGAAECTTIKIQMGPFHHSHRLGFSTWKLGLRLKFILGRKKDRQKNAQWPQTCNVDF